MPNQVKADSATPGRTPKRLPWLDVLRAVAIGDIVGIHTIGHHPLWGMGLPVFLLCTFALGAKRTPPHPWAQNAKRRAARLLLPWLFWCAVYGVLNTLNARVTGDRVFGDLMNPELKMLWVGTEILLWYLPFAFLAEVLINTILQRVDKLHNRAPALSTAAWLAGGAALPTLIVLLFGDRVLPPHMKSYFTGALVIPLGIGLGLILRYYHQKAVTCIGLVVAGLAMMATHRVAVDQGVLDPGLRLAYWQWRIGLALVLIGLALVPRFGVPKALGWMAMFTFPVYLLHPIVGGVIHQATKRTGIEVPDLTLWLVVWALSLGAAVLAKRTPIVKRYC